MKKYRVTVNGTAYEIELEELTGATPAATPAPTPATTAAPASGEQVSAPMPGTILSINVTQGATVKAGDVLMILEAMKMENEIMSPCNGTVASITTTQGAVVESGTPLCVIQ